MKLQYVLRESIAAKASPPVPTVRPASMGMSQARHWLRKRALVLARRVIIVLPAPRRPQSVRPANTGLAQVCKVVRALAPVWPAGTGLAQV